MGRETTGRAASYFGGHRSAQGKKTAPSFQFDFMEAARMEAMR
jgi:hypothetical protein